MYIPDQFREARPEVLRDFVARHPLGALVAMTSNGLTANHIPMIWRDREGTPGVLHGHVARTNPLWQSVTAGAEVLVVFGGANQYISPSWYPAKQEHGKVVPTWNYSVVHINGAIRFDEDASHNLRHVSQLTDAHEASRPERWQVSDAPTDYIAPMLKRILSFEIAIAQVVGKFKASQHRPDDERLAVSKALREENVPDVDIDEVVRAPNSR